MKARQAGGGNSSGRYKKHDTARNRCLQRTVYPGLAMGELPTADDAKMLFDLPGPTEITGRPTYRRVVQHIYARSALER